MELLLRANIAIKDPEDGRRLKLAARDEQQNPQQQPGTVPPPTANRPGNPRMILDLP